MTLQEFMQWCFLASVSGGVYILWLLFSDVRELNVKIALILERTMRHEAALEKHEERIRELEIR